MEVASGGSSSSSSSSKAGYDKFQKCLSDAASGGSATKSQIRTCFDSTYGAGGSSGSGSGSSGSGSGSSGSGSGSGSSGSGSGSSGSGSGSSGSGSGVAAVAVVEPSDEVTIIDSKN